MSMGRRASIPARGEVLQNSVDEMGGDVNGKKSLNTYSRGNASELCGGSASELCGRNGG